MTLDLVVLAAGRSARFGAPKQLVPVGPNGETLLDYTVYSAHRAGCDVVVLIVRPDLEERFAAHVARSFGTVLTVRYRRQDPDPRPGRGKPWGTAEALLAAESAVRGAFVVANADDWYGPTALETVARHHRSADTHTEFAMAGYRLADTLPIAAGGVSRAVCSVDQEGFLADLVETYDIVADGRRGFRGRDGHGDERRFDGNETVSMNLWGLTPAVFPILRRAFEAFRDAFGDETDREFLLSAEIGAAVRRGDARVRVLPVREEAFGVTHADDAPRVRRRVAELTARGRVPPTPWAAVPNRAGSC